MTDEEVDKNGYNFDVPIVLLPHPVDILMIGGALAYIVLVQYVVFSMMSDIIGDTLAYIVLLSLMFILSELYVYRKHKRG